MAGDWIKMRTDLITSPKVVRMASALKADRCPVVGGLYSVWCLFDMHSEDGTLHGYTLDTIDELIAWKGFGKAMAAVGWLVPGDGFTSVPRFEEHNGASAKRRAQEAQRKRTTRGQTSAPHADKMRTREEKRREEKNSASQSSGDKPPRSSKKAPKDFAITPEMAIWASEHAPKINASEETDKFKDHTFKSGITDFNGAWRNWIRNAAEFAASRAPRNGSHKPHQSDEERDREARRLLGFDRPPKGTQEILDA